MFKHVNHPPLSITILLLTLSLALALSACQPTTPAPTPGLNLEETPLEGPTDSGAGTLLPVATSQPPAPSPAPMLILEEYPLESPPDPDEGTFLPVGTSQDAVLAKHQAERERTVTNQYFTVAGNINPRTTSLGPGPEYTAVLEESDSEPFRQSVTLLQGDEVIFSVDAGLPSPSLPLQGLWSTLDHWVLEIYYIDESSGQGQVFKDGDFLNHSLNYQDVFGFQLLAGKPFYFFQREDGLGYSYDGEETSLPYEHILHYGCCSAASLNPIPAENMVAFFALIGDDWFYIELGVFELE